MLRRVGWMARFVVLSALWSGTLVPVSAAPIEQAPSTSTEILPAPKVDTVESSPSGPVFLDRVIDAADYLVGPGDKFRITIVGEVPTTMDIIVSPEATVVLPVTGAESVRGKTLTQVRDDLTRILRGFYPKGGATVSLVEVRRFRVTVSGAVRNPGLYVASANTRASEVLSAAGMDDRAAKRGLRLLRGEEILTVDLVAFDRLGRRAANPYLTEGDVINVPAKDARWGMIEVVGAVNGAGRFDFVEGEHVGDLLDLAYGLSPDADTMLLELWRFYPGETVARRLEWPVGSRFSEWRQTLLMVDDRLIVRGVGLYRQKLSVHVVGEVRRAGTYVFPKAGIPLHEVIDSAGGFTAEADLEHASIVRWVPQNWLSEYEKRISLLSEDLWSRSESEWMAASALSSPGRVSTDFVRLFQKGDREYDVLLSNGDRVIIPARSTSVSVIGRVVQPGLVTHIEGGDLTYYLRRVGGYSWRADRRGTFIVKAGTGTSVRKNDIKSIEPGDLIVVPTQRGKRFWNGLKESLVVASSVATMYLVIHQATR
jgi:protein involved in polysaccharide export with SLBB domain